MKISYERLNEIIEEEVVRFKRLNEQDTVLPGKINLDFKQFNDAVVALKNSIKDQAAINKIADQLKLMATQPKT
jgi:hypothetical protein